MKPELSSIAEQSLLSGVQVLGTKFNVWVWV